jgi:signal peptidase I
MFGFIQKSNAIKPWRISSISMKPNLVIGDHFIVNMRYYRSEKPKRGDVIVFFYPKDPSKDFVKRIIALGGERIEIIKDKIYVNEEVIEDPWGHYDEKSPSARYLQPVERFGPVIVPKGSVFVLGDNRNNSQDSRHFGFVNVSDIKGKVLYIYWARDKRRIGTNLNTGSTK